LPGRLSFENRHATPLLSEVPNSAVAVSRKGVLRPTVASSRGRSHQPGGAVLGDSIPLLLMVVAEVETVNDESFYALPDTPVDRPAGYKRTATSGSPCSHRTSGAPKFSLR
jgi:hypothetical protein